MFTNEIGNKEEIMKIISDNQIDLEKMSHEIVW